MHRASSSRIAFSAFAACLTAAATLHSAQGADLFVSGHSGAVLRVNIETGLSTWVNACGGPVQSMAQVGGDMLLGDTSGNVYRVNLADDSIGYAFTVDNSDNTAMAASGSDVFLSNSEGTIRRLNAANGNLIQTLHSPNPVNAMIIADDFIYVAGPTGDVFRANLAGGTFQYFACACLGVINSLAVTTDALIASDVNGTTLRFNRTTGLITGGFTVQGDSSAISVQSDVGLFISDSTGNVRSVNAVTGQVGDIFLPGISITSMALVDTGPAPCPADFNDDGEVTSADFFLFVSRFLNAPLSSDLSADINHDGVITSADFFAYLTHFFNGCN